MSFLKKDYKVPSDQKYLNKFPQGETNFRVLSSAIVGYLYWTEDNKPIISRIFFLPEYSENKLRYFLRPFDTRSVKLKSSINRGNSFL